MDRRAELETAIAALEAQRSVLGDAVVDTSVTSLREQLSALDDAPSDAPSRDRLRRQATVLFADVSGFTAMSESMDVEDVTDAVNGLWADLDHEVLAHGGVIDKHIGDALMAVWGTVQPREDDPERAVRCALAMQEHVRDFTESVTLRSPGAPQPSLRIGINTGPVLLSTIGVNAEYTAMGDTVNTASRIESAAGRGEVVISRDTYRLVRGVFFAKQREPVQVKGKSEPLSLYVIEGARPRAFRLPTRGVEGVETRMIGRDRELATLKSRTEESRDTRATLVTTVEGEPGVGKSRLLYEYRNWLELRDPVRYFFGAGTEETHAEPFALLRDVLSFRFEINDTDAADVIAKKLIDGFEEIVGAGHEDDAAVLGHLAGWGFDDAPAVTEQGGDPGRLRARGAAAFASMLRGASEAHPVVLVLEDLHWSDEPSLDLVRVLTEDGVDGPVHAVLFSRPELFDRRRDLAAAPRAVHLRLDTLTQTDTSALLAEILQRADGVPEQLQHLVASRAGGNPFFVEELVSMLIDAGAIVAGTDRWSVDLDRLDRVRVPTTVAEIVESRLSRLEPDERAALEAAAVIGTELWDVAIAAATGHDIDDVRPSLDVLVARDFLTIEPTSSVADAVEYRFRHAITRDVTYATVLKARRTDLHRAAARWFSARLGASGAGFETTIARHHDLGGESELAADWYLRAAASAEIRSGFAEARELLARAEKIGTDPQRLDALIAAGRVAGIQGDPEPAGRWLDEAADLARRLDDDIALLKALSEHARIALLVRGDVEGIEAWIDEGLVVLERVDDVGARVGFLRQLGTIGLVTGDHETAAARLAEALALLPPDELTLDRALLSNNLSHVRTEQGRYDEALALSEEVRELAIALGNRRVLMGAVAHVGLVALRRGDPAAALPSFEEAQTLNRAVGDLENLATVANYLGACRLGIGDPEGARREFREALTVGAEHGVTTEVVRAVVGLARIRALTGDVDGAARMAATAVAHPACNWEAAVFAEPVLAAGSSHPQAEPEPEAEIEPEPVASIAAFDALVTSLLEDTHHE